MTRRTAAKAGRFSADNIGRLARAFAQARARVRARPMGGPEAMILRKEGLDLAIEAVVAELKLVRPDMNERAFQLQAAFRDWDQAKVDLNAGAKLALERTDTDD